MTEKELRRALLDAKARNEAAYEIIGMTAGVEPQRVKEIAEGAKPTFRELAILEVIAG